MNESKKNIMNTKSFLMSALVLLSFFAIPFAMNGQTKTSPVTWIAANQGYANTELVTNFTIEANAIEGLLDKSTGSSAPVYYTSNAGVRMYANNTLSVSTLAGFSLNSIEYVWRKQGSKTYASSTLISSGGTYTPGAAPSNATTDVIDTWTYNGDFKGIVTIRLGSGQRVFRQITVTYTGSVGQTYQVNYYPNTENSINPVVDPTSYAMGASVTVLSPSALNITNSGHVFTKWSTVANGQGGTDYLPGDQFTMGDSNVNLYAQWTSTNGTTITELTPSVVNTAMGNQTGYCTWTVTDANGAVYAGKSFRSDAYIQITNSQSGNSKYSGIVTTTSAGTVKKVQVIWNSNTAVGRTLNVYGKNTAYTATSDLYGNTCGTLLGTLTKGATSTSELILGANDDYEYIGLVSQSGAMYFDKIMVTWQSGTANTPTILIEPSPIALGNVVINQPLQTTFVVSQANLTDAISLTVSSGTMSWTDGNQTYQGATVTIPRDNDPTAVTWSFTPTATSDLPVTITATSGTASLRVNITGTVLPANNFDPLHASKAAFLNDPTATEVKINLHEVEVVGQVGSYLYLQDADAGLLVYGPQAPAFEKGYKFNQGYLLGTYVNYNGITEVTNFSFVGYGGAVGNLTCTVATVDQILANPVTYESRYVQVNNTTISSWTLPGSNALLAFYDVFHTNYALCTAPETNHVFTVKGMVNRHWSNSAVNIELAPTALSDISTTNLAAAPTITAGGTQGSPAEMTFVDLAPGLNSTAVYSMWRNVDNVMTLVVDNQRITQSTDVNIIGLTEIKIHGERDFYANSAEVDYWYDLPANTHSIQFSINGVIDQANTVLVTGTLSPTQLPEVITYGDYGLAGWSLSASSTTPIDISNYTFTDDAVLYAIYFKGTSFTYNKVNTLNELVDGEYVITCSSGSSPYTFVNSQATSSPAAVTLTSLNISVSGNTLTGSDADLETISWSFSGSPSAMTITSKAYPQYWLYTANSNTGVRVGSIDDTWELTEDNLVTSLFNMQSNRTDRYLALYNNQDWRCYTTIGVTNSYPRMALFKKTPVLPSGSFDGYTRVFWNETATADITISGPSIIPSGCYLHMGEYTMTNATAANFIIEDGASFIPASGNSGIKAMVKKDIVGYGNSDIAGWVLLSSPVGTLTPNVYTNETHVDNLVGNFAYDLYGFDQTQGSEWRNNKVTNQTFGAQGGLLYASQNDRTITFVGTVNATVTSTNPVSLVYSANAGMAGWNLVGNPFTSEGYLVMSQGLTDFYRLEDYTNGDNEMESHFVSYAATNAVAPMEGVFVQATAANQTYYFKNFQRGTAQGLALVNLTLTNRNDNVVDMARVRFNNGAMMAKMVFNEHNAKLYIPQDGKDYAVVRTQNEGEIPVNFKTRENATYTLSVNPEDVEMDYLHLIDNLTGADIDLLATPTYTFEARFDDYPSRFRLVFSSNDENGASTSSTFAYYDGNSWVVSNIGEATLQVIDVMGRIVMSQQISGNATANIDMPGVYVLRLVNGDDVKVQKVVVR
jgi:hypothetical protein